MTKRLNIPKTNLSPNFIGSWEMKSIICDQIITYYNKHKAKQKQGTSGKGIIDLNVKDRKDITIFPNELNLPENEILNQYFANLFEFYKDYNNQWPFLASMVKKVEIGSFNIGKYSAGQHFQIVHTERSGLGNLQRLLAFMTYLNDVKDGGSTYFTHYDLDIQPAKGLTLIWPAEWTHAHKGNIINSGSKYILTGWLCFPQ